jgi:hypothetical protein
VREAHKLQRPFVLGSARFPTLRAGDLLGTSVVMHDSARSGGVRDVGTVGDQGQPPGLAFGVSPGRERYRSSLQSRSSPTRATAVQRDL